MKVWRYRLQEPSHQLGGWLIVVFDSTGFFGVTSDFGHAAAHFHGLRGCDDPRSFLASIKPDYFCRQTGVEKVIDVDASIENIKRVIDEMEGDGLLTPAGAEVERELIAELEVDGFSADVWCSRTDIPDAWEDLREAYPEELQHLAATMLPLLSQAIKAELAAEAAAAEVAS